MRFMRDALSRYQYHNIIAPWKRKWNIQRWQNTIAAICSLKYNDYNKEDKKILVFFLEKKLQFGFNHWFDEVDEWWMMDKVKVSRLSQFQVNFSKKIISVFTNISVNILKDNFPCSNQEERSKKKIAKNDFIPARMGLIIDSKTTRTIFLRKTVKNEKDKNKKQKTRKVEPDDETV